MGIDGTKSSRLWIVLGRKALPVRLNYDGVSMLIRETTGLIWWGSFILLLVFIRMNDWGGCLFVDIIICMYVRTNVHCEHIIVKNVPPETASEQIMYTKECQIRDKTHP